VTDQALGEEGTEAEAPGAPEQPDVFEALRAVDVSFLKLARQYSDAFVERVMRDEESGALLRNDPMHDEWHMLADEFDRLIIMAYPESGKRLAVDTRIPTPSGWKAMGELRTGDVVFGGDGKPCTVVQATKPVLGRMYRVAFSDGSCVLADGEHLWSVKDASRRHAHTRGKPQRVVSTDEILGAGLRCSDARYRWSVPLPGAVEYPAKPLPVPPYVLGAWLGDGSSACATLHFGTAGRYVWDRCVGMSGGTEPKERKPGVWTGTLGRKGSVYRQLRKLCVLGSRAKRIPESYLLADIESRRELLAGLLDTGGSVSNGSSGGSSIVELMLCNGPLADDALQLIRSLGFKATKRESDAKLNGRVVGRRWRICFTAREPVFHMPAKLDNQRLGDARRVGGRQKWKAISSIEQVDSCLARCIAVDSSDRTYLCTDAYTVTHNTNSIVIGKALCDLGRDPTLRMIFISKTYGQAEKITRTMRNMIDHSEALHEVFPNLRSGTKWTDGQFTVKRPYISKTPSVQALGFRGAITGARVDRLYIDDLEDDENTRTEPRRRDTQRWLSTTVMNRLTRRGRVVWTTNAWHPKDAAHVMSASPRWKIARYPVIRDGLPTFPQRYSLERIEKLRTELTPRHFAQVYLNEVREESAGEFHQGFIEKAKEAGRGYTFVERLDALPDGAIVVTGVDLATGRTGKGKSDLTTLVTVLCYPDNVRQILCVESGRWQGPEILRRLCMTYARYNGSATVEDNGAQVYLLQFADALLSEGMELPPIYPWTTGKNKWNASFGVASLAVEMARGQWIYPCTEAFPGCPVEQLVCPPELEALIQEELDFKPDGSHTGDRLMAKWFARELIRKITRFKAVESQPSVFTGGDAPTTAHAQEDHDDAPGNGAAFGALL